MTNTVFNDSDVQRAPNAGLTPAFARAFLVLIFGIHVQGDRHQTQNLPQDLVFLGLGLSSRLPNGEYRLAEGYYTDIFVLPKSATETLQRQTIGQRPYCPRPRTRHSGRSINAVKQVANSLLPWCGKASALFLPR